MRIFPTEKSRILLLCMGFVALLAMTYHLLQNDRYKSGYAYLFYRCCATGDAKAVLGLFKPIDFYADFFGLIFEGKTGEAIDNQILCFGAQEKHILFFMRDLAKLLGKDRVVFLDIGANIGQHSLYMSRHAREVHSFEPYPPVLNRFRRLVALNHINNIYIHPVGLGNQTGYIPFFESANTNLEGSFVDKGKNANKEIRLPLVIGDEWLRKSDTPHVDIIKCDIEGYEKQALLGLKHTLEDNRPIVVMELNLGIEESFQNLDDFYATFPPDYEYLHFCKQDPYTGYYEFCNYDFGKKEGNIIVYPIEKKGLILDICRNQKGHLDNQL